MSKVAKAVGAVVVGVLATVIGGPLGASLFATHALMGAALMKFSNYGLIVRDREGRAWIAT
jgi:hypothetical protein